MKEGGLVELNQEILDIPTDTVELSEDVQASLNEYSAGMSLMEMFQSETEPKNDGSAEQKEANRQKVAEQLIAHYSDQQFAYSKYSGTVSQMLIECSFIIGMLDDGFDEAVSFLDEYRIDSKEAKKNDSEEEQNDEDEQSSILDRSKERDDNEVVVKKDSLTQVPEQNSKRETVKNEKMPKAVDITGKELGEAEQIGAAKVIPVAPPLIEKDLPTPKQDTSELKKPRVEENKQDAESFKALDSDPKAEAKERAKPDAPVLSEDTASEEVPEDVFKEETVVLELSGDEQDIEFNEDTETPKLHISEEIIQEVKPIDKDAEDPSAKYGGEVEPEPGLLIDNSQFELALEGEQLTDDVSVDDEDLVTRNEEEVPEVAVEDMIIEYFEAWSELAKQETPVEELFIAVTEKIETNTESIALFQDEEPIELFSDEVLYNEARPEFLVLFRKIQSAEASLTQLYAATSKEECHTYIDELIESLASVLRSLGYENPEKIIRDFLSTHSPETIQKLLVELENAFRRTMAQEINHRRTKHAYHKIRLGKIASYIMSVIRPKNKLSYDTDRS